MLNIISLQALRKKSTWPSKVAKNLMKWLDLIWEPYIINWDPEIFKNIYILDDIPEFNRINKYPHDCEILVWPIIESRKNIPDEIADRYRYVYASNWIKDLWDKYKWHKHSIARPVWIDTYEYIPSKDKKTDVLIYFKTRYPEELKLCEDILKEQKIKYNIINYDIWYKEKDFLNYLKKTKYVIRIWRQETQWIALEEVLSMNIPVLLRDVRKVDDWSPNTEYEKKSYNWNEWKEFATSAYYFDEKCWIKFYNKEDLKKYILSFEKNYKEFSPRKYVEENLSLEKQAKEFINYYKIPSRWNDIKNKKYIKNNLLLKLWRFLIDSPIFSIFYKPIVKLYQKITKIV